MARLAEVLVVNGLLDAGQVEHCRGLSAKSGRPLGASAIAAGFATGRQVLEVLALPLNEPIEDFVPEGLEPGLAGLLPGELALQLKCLPVHDDGTVLSVAFANEVDDLELERLASQTGRQIEAFLTDPAVLEAGHGLLYGGAGADLAEAGPEAAPAEAPADAEDSSLESLDLSGPAGAQEEETAEGGGEATMPELGDFKGVMSEALGEFQVVAETDEKNSAYGIEIEANSPPVVKLVNGILIKAMSLRASDIHIEPQERELRVRVRVDGDMHAMMRLPKAVAHKISSRIKIMSSMNITERRQPLDGRFKVTVGPGATVEFRVSSLPSVHGEKIVIRVLGGSKLKGDVTGLGFNDRDLRCVEEALHSSCGMVLVTGPTGSGKTTSLYTMLKSLNTPDRNVVTAEDPVEYNLPGLTQVPMNPVAGLTFEKALRAFLRQDPDVILVGEIRDFETAEIAAKAAMTGHMVLSTLHTNDAPSTILRLRHMGVAPFLLVSSLRMVIAQRLVRLLCPSCRVEHKPGEDEILGLKPDEVARLGTLYKCRGCEECHGGGVRGRRPVYEVLPIQSNKMKAALLEPQAAAIEALGREEGMKSLRENALDLAAQGVISLAEALRVGAAAG